MPDLVGFSLCFVPLTQDKRLSAKEIVGNRKKLTEEQASLKRELAEAKGGGLARRLEEAQRKEELEELRLIVDSIPPEILDAAKRVAKYKAQER